MLAKRVIATILLRDGMIVQSKQFKHTNVIGNAKTAIDFFNKWSADEIVILDVSRTDDNHKEFLEIVEDFGNKCFVPLTVGGYIRSLHDIRDCLNAGADKVVINTEAYNNPDFISEGAVKFGSQCIVISIDTIDQEVIIDRGKQKTGKLVWDWAKEVEQKGAGEIYLTPIKFDGMGYGYHLGLIQGVVENVTIPVIASGGCGTWEHCLQAFQAGADAVSVANKFHYSEHSVNELKKFLYNAGTYVRPPAFTEV